LQNKGEEQEMVDKYYRKPPEEEIKKGIEGS